MTCSYEEALQIEEDFLIFAKEVKEKNSSKWSNNEKVIKSKLLLMYDPHLKIFISMYFI